MSATPIIKRQTLFAVTGKPPAGGDNQRQTFRLCETETGAIEIADQLSLQGYQDVEVYPAPTPLPDAWDLKREAVAVHAS